MLNATWSPGKSIRIDHAGEMALIRMDGAWSEERDARAFVLDGPDSFVVTAVARCHEWPARTVDFHPALAMRIAHAGEVLHVRCGSRTGSGLTVGFDGPCSFSITLPRARDRASSRPPLYGPAFAQIRARRPA